MQNGLKYCSYHHEMDHSDDISDEHVAIPDESHCGNPYELKLISQGAPILLFMDFPMAQTNTAARKVGFTSHRTGHALQHDAPMDRWHDFYPGAHQKLTDMYTYMYIYIYIHIHMYVHTHDSTGRINFE